VVVAAAPAVEAVEAVVAPVEAEEEEGLVEALLGAESEAPGQRARPGNP
jgi:hypothetical protein